MEKYDKIYVAGHTGLFGSAIIRELEKRGYNNIVTKTHQELDLTNQKATLEFMMSERPDYVFVAAAKVGGIQANRDYMADFAMINMQITSNILDAAHKAEVKKLLYLGSSCIYPKECEQPIAEHKLLTGQLEPTNEGYALAKIFGVRMCQYYKKQYGDNFISCIPANVYGPNDSFEIKSCHVIPAQIMKFHNAKRNGLSAVEIWGTGKPMREFLYIDDAADACVFLMENYDGFETVNIGVGIETSIKELVQVISEVIGYQGEIVFDTSKPDGMMRRVLDDSMIRSLGYRPRVSLKEGISREYNWYLENIEK